MPADTGKAQADIVAWLGKHPKPPRTRSRFGQGGVARAVACKK